MSTMFADTVLIVFISVCTALLAEGITWVLVYRTEKYKRLKAEVEKQSKKLEKKKETITESAGRQQKKKIERQEEKLKNNNRDLSMVRMKSMFAIGFCFTALMGMFNSIFDGRVVAKLPFIPLSYIQGLSHRNLLGEDYTDCSFIFLYILCTMSIRQISVAFSSGGAKGLRNPYSRSAEEMTLVPTSNRGVRMGLVKWLNNRMKAPLPQNKCMDQTDSLPPSTAGSFIKSDLCPVLCKGTRQTN
ncbi:calcium load-activated calcium channel isoform X1 [Terrapene carolina triunguis]|uniref:calcium load-activated calcium channel isoform X1 n=1 Tax=Terrapene triunguis TaxID=2587831 RepID=UPI000E778744|nr:calcium load-activated calcium channel isoform X1 [Terrapene carolina triunguis]